MVQNIGYGFELWKSMFAHKNMQKFEGDIMKQDI